MQDQKPYKRFVGAALIALIILGLLLRMNGLFRGLEADYIFHPDSPKQVAALGNYLEDRYVWYVGSLFYDGYPLGLSHVDEWILRPCLALQQAVRDFMTPESLPTPPDRIALYYWSRSLRVIYSLLCLGLVWSIAGRLLGNRGSALVTITLAAIAPLPLVVSHSATGDIGVDLFTLAALLCLVRQAERPHPAWLFLAALSVGMAFSAKYQGALAGALVFVYLLFSEGPPRRWLRLLRGAFVVALGALTGLLLGTPALLINANRTWSDIRANFDFIRHYNVSAEFLAKTPWQKLAQSVSVNTPLVVGALGWVLSLLALAGLVTAFLEWHRLRLSGIPDARRRNQAALVLALCLFPFLAIAVSLLGKPSVQPFHFSYLQFPIIVAATTFLQALWHHPRRSLRLTALVLLAAALAETGLATERESFFWRRADNMAWETRLPEALLKDPDAHEEDTCASIKALYLEPSSLPIFRNASLEVPFPHAVFWNRIGIAPVPDIPFSLDQDWIFANGPVFPMNDRMFWVKRNSTECRHVVFHTQPGTVRIGLRAGSWPVFVSLDYGGDRQTLALAPNSQRILSFSPRRCRHMPGDDTNPDGSFLVPLSVESTGGALAASVMTRDEETHLFRLFGGDLTTPAELLPDDVPAPELDEELEALNYLAGQAHTELNAPSAAALPFRKESLPLACGVFLVITEFRCLTDAATIRIRLNDIHRSPDLAQETPPILLTNGLNIVTSRFTKAFAPYECQLEAVNLMGRERLEAWTLAPDTPTMRADLQAWISTGQRPAWCGRGLSPLPPPPGWNGIPVTFDHSIRLTRLVFPETLRNGTPVPLACDFELLTHGLANFQDYVFFIHLLDKEGHTVRQFHAQLWQAMALGSLNRPLLCEAPTGLRPGLYGLEMGLYNARTEQRLTIQGEGLSSRERRKRNYVFGTTTVVE